jgi:hypothetical protein
VVATTTETTTETTTVVATTTATSVFVASKFCRGQKEERGRGKVCVLVPS